MPLPWGTNCICGGVPAGKEIGRVAGRARERFAKFHPGGFNILAQTDPHVGFVSVPRATNASTFTSA